MGASFLKIPHLLISEDEAEKLSAAINRVTELYDMPIVDEKTQAFINLAIVAGGIYGPRIVSYTIDSKKTKQMKTAPAPVVPFPDLTQNGANSIQ